MTHYDYVCVQGCFIYLLPLIMCYLISLFFDVFYQFQLRVDEVMLKEQAMTTPEILIFRLDNWLEHAMLEMSRSAEKS